jgi:hypothetical protein
VIATRRDGGHPTYAWDKPVDMCPGGAKRNIGDFLKEALGPVPPQD